MKAFSAQPTVALGIAGCGFALTCLAASMAYAGNAAAGIYAVISRSPAEASRLAALADWYHVAQLILGVFALIVALCVGTRKRITDAARWASLLGLVLGVACLLCALALL